MVVFWAAQPLLAQQPRLANAKFETRAVPSGLDREFRSIASAESGAAWIGYAVRAIPGEHQMCCYSSFEDGAGNRCCRGCSLERHKGAEHGFGVTPAPVSLEGAGYIFVLFRIEQHAVDRIRTFSADCELDGGGLPCHWFTGVPTGRERRAPERIRNAGWRRASGRNGAASRPSRPSRCTPIRRRTRRSKHLLRRGARNHYGKKPHSGWVARGAAGDSRCCAVS